MSATLASALVVAFTAVLVFGAFDAHPSERPGIIGWLVFIALVTVGYLLVFVK